MVRDCAPRRRAARAPAPVPDSGLPLGRAAPPRCFRAVPAPTVSGIAHHNGDRAGPDGRRTAGWFPRRGGGRPARAACSRLATPPCLSLAQMTREAVYRCDVADEEVRCDHRRKERLWICHCAVFRRTQRAPELGFRAHPAAARMHAMGNRTMDFRSRRRAAGARRHTPLTAHGYGPVRPPDTRDGSQRRSYLAPSSASRRIAEIG